MESVAARLLYGCDPGTLWHYLFTCAKDSCRLVVWISTGILRLHDLLLRIRVHRCWRDRDGRFERCPGQDRAMTLFPEQLSPMAQCLALADRLSGVQVASADQEDWTQFSSVNPGTRSNSRVLLVTSVLFWLSAWAAIMVSRAPMGVPLRSSSARRSP